MRVVCRHGHFAFYPADSSELQRFMRLFKLPLYREEDYFTLEALLDLPRWSQAGAPYGNLPAVVNYEGRRPWDAMRANGFVFDLVTQLLIPLTTVTQTVTLSQTQDCAIASRPLIQPGAFYLSGVRVLSYSAGLDLRFQRLYLDSWEHQP